MGVIAALLLARATSTRSTVPLVGEARLRRRADPRAPRWAAGGSSARSAGASSASRPIDGFASQTASTAVILGASSLGAPVSTTQVVASSVVGVGGGRRRWRHVRWAVVRVDRLRLAADPSRHRGAGRGYARASGRRSTEAPTLVSARRARTCSGCSREQTAVTVEGMDALVAWADGRRRRRPTACACCEHRADEHKRELRAALTRGVLDAARARGHLRALARPRRGPQQREEHRARGGGHAASRPTRRSPRWPRELADGTGHLAEAFALARRRRRARPRPTAADRGRQEPAPPRARLPRGDVRPDRGRRPPRGRRPARALPAARADERRSRRVAERVWYSVLKES